MAPANQPEKANTEKSFEHEFVAALLATLSKGGEKIVTVDNDYISKLTVGTLDLTKSAIEHRLRTVKKRAEYLNTAMAEKINSGEVQSVVSPTKKRSNGDGENSQSPTKKPKTAKAKSPKVKTEDKSA